MIKKNYIQFLFVFLLSSFCFSAESYDLTEGSKKIAVFKKYLGKLVEISGLDINEERLCDHFKSETIGRKWRMKNSLNDSHDLFVANKKYLRDEWARQYKKKNWPQHKFQNKHAHHIIPQIYGGPNEWWNLLALTPTQHRNLHCSEDSICRELFPQACGHPEGIRGGGEEYYWQK